MGAPKDTDTRKHTSNGVQAVICAISEEWEGPITQEEFAKRFTPYRMDMLEIYKGHQRSRRGRASDDRKWKGTKEFVSRIVEGRQDPSFHQLRAFAHYLNDIPVGLLMLYTQLVSDASHNHKKEDLLNLLESFEAAVHGLKAWLRDNEPVGALINHVPTENSEGLFEFKAHVTGLRKAVETFIAERKTPDRSADKIQNE